MRSSFQQMLSIFTSSLLITLSILANHVTGEYISPLENFESTSSVEVIRQKRSTTTTMIMTYKCHSKHCINSVCTPRSYEGPNPPEWCSKNLQPHKSQTSCKWSKSCNGSQCKTENNCRYVYEDLRRAGQIPNTFDFKCHESSCKVNECQGSRCSQGKWISKSEFEKGFLRKLPMCKDVEAVRDKRSPEFVKALQGYCCDVVKQWQGVTIGIVRPIRR